MTYFKRANSFFGFETLSFMVIIFIVAILAGVVDAQQRYVPGIWIDPDGCQHWVMDDGAEGYMTPHLARDGRPVCKQRTLCAELAGDQLFQTDSARITDVSRQKLRNFFKSAQQYQFVIVGHTDSRGSQAYNLRLSNLRAQAVASIGKSSGAKILAIHGLGEGHPKVSNSTLNGMAKNRRVEIICVS